MTKASNMRGMNTAWLLCLLFALECSQVRSQAVRVEQAGTRARAVLGGSITVTAAPTFVSFRLVPDGVAAGSAGVGINTAWMGLSRPSRINLYGYFFSAGAALSGGSPLVSIPASAVWGQVPGGTPLSFTPFTQSGPVTGASLLLFCEPSMTSGNGSRSDTLNLQIDLQGVPRLPAGIYMGTLYLQAQML